MKGFINCVHKNPNIQSFFLWYKQIATELGFAKPVSHATDNKAYIVKQMLLFVPVVLIGFVWTIVGGG